MKKSILSLVVILLTVLSSNAQSDTIVFRNSNNYELGVAIGDDYYPFTNISENSARIFKNAGYSIKKPNQDLLELYYAGEFSFKSEKQKLKIKNKKTLGRGYYLKLSGMYKNAAMAVQGAGSTLVLLMSRDNPKAAAVIGAITTVSSIGLNTAGNNALIKAGEVK